MSGERNVGIPLSVATAASVRVNYRKGMTWADGVISNHLANGWVAASAVPVGNSPVGLIEIGAEFEARVYPKIIGKRVSTSWNAEQQHCRGSDEHEEVFHIGFSGNVSWPAEIVVTAR
jgi:hypothetical protein